MTDDEKKVMKEVGGLLAQKGGAAPMRSRTNDEYRCRPCCLSHRHFTRSRHVSFISIEENTMKLKSQRIL